jgi:hypothetical protein
VEAERDVSPEVDPNEYAFARPPGGGATIPFAKDSEEARAIAQVIEEAERERSAVSKAEKNVSVDVDLDESPFALPPGSGATIPFAKDSEEAQAIQAVIEEIERERAAAEASED